MKLAFAMPHMIELKATIQPWELAVTGREQTMLAKKADALGYDMIAVPEHFIIPNEHMDLSGPHHFHGYSAMAHFAGATENIRVNSCITILPLQHPIVAAKALSTMDFLSGGRAMVTVAVGWLEREFELLGVPFKERGRRTDEYLAAMIELWTSDEPEFEGEFVSFRNVAFAPRPVQKPHLPVWIGGDADGPLKRAARHASGWWPFLTKPEDISARIDFIKSQPDYNGQLTDVFYGISTGRVGEGHKVLDDPNAQPGKSLDWLVDRLGFLAEQGVTFSSIPVPPVTHVEAYVDYCTWVIEEVRPRVQ